MWHAVRMARHHVKLSDQATAVIESQIASGRYKDISAAIQEAVWKSFVGVPDVFEEYNVTPEEVSGAARRSRREIEQDRKAGKLKPFTP